MHDPWIDEWEARAVGHGAHRVYFLEDRCNKRTAYDTQQRVWEWCSVHCSGAFHVGITWASFRLHEDDMLFKLTWG
jgi:hypothetical protein